MATTIDNEFLTYFSSLTATNPICSTLGQTFTQNSNLFVRQVPPTDTVATCLTIITKASVPPRAGGSAMGLDFQTRLRGRNLKTCLETVQDIIYELDENDNILATPNRGKSFAIFSDPQFVYTEEGGEYKIVIADFRLLYKKLAR